MRIEDIKDEELRELARLRFEQCLGYSTSLDTKVVCFKWSETPEGLLFWSNVNIEQRTTVHDFEPAWVHVSYTDSKPNRRQTLRIR